MNLVSNGYKTSSVSLTRGVDIERRAYRGGQPGPWSMESEGIGSKPTMYYSSHECRMMDTAVLDRQQ